MTIETLDYEPGIAFFQQRVRPFDLFQGPLYRFEIYQAPSNIYLFQDIHHAVFDGISVLILQEDLLRAINGETLEPEVFSTFDLAVEEQELLTGNAGTESEGVHYLSA